MGFVARRSTSMSRLVRLGVQQLIGEQPRDLRQPFVVDRAGASAAVAAGVGDLEVADRRGEGARERGGPAMSFGSTTSGVGTVSSLSWLHADQARRAEQRDADGDAAGIERSRVHWFRHWVGGS